MTLTTTTAESALKTFYLDAVTDQLNLKANPFLARVRQSTSDVYGREVKKLVRLGMNGGVAAGTETGDLPTSNYDQYAAFTLTLKNLYGTIEISDKAIRSSSNSEGAFVNLLDEEMNSLVTSASYNLSRMLFGDGSGLLGKIVSASADNITVDSAKNFTEGMLMDLYNATGVKQESNLYVKSVDREKNIVKINKTLSSSSVTGYSFYAAGSKDLELSGLGSIFGGTTLYGHTRSENTWLQPYSKNVEELTEADIQLAIDMVEEKSGGKINFIVCSWGVRRALIKILSQKYVTVNTMELEGGYQAISFNGIPVVVDRFCPKGTMYLLNTDDFVLYQLCDWQWLEDEGGKILKQIPGKPVFTATLVKYADLMCCRPCGQARLTGITEE